MVNIRPVKRTNNGGMATLQTLIVDMTDACCQGRNATSARCQLNKHPIHREPWLCTPVSLIYSLHTKTQKISSEI